MLSPLNGYSFLHIKKRVRLVKTLRMTCYKYKEFLNKKHGMQALRNGYPEENICNPL